MRLRRLWARAAFLGTVLLLCGCSGSAWYQRTDGLAGSNIVYDQAIFRALERIISVCGNPRLQPGADHFNGEEFFLHNCATANGHDFTALTQGQANPDRLQNLAFLLGTINEPLAARIPQGLPGRDIRRQAQLLTWLIPGFEQGIDRMDAPEQVKDFFRAMVETLLGGAQCEFVAHVGIDLLPLQLNMLHFSWQPIPEAAILRMTTALGAPQARAQLTSSIKCFGSTQNLPNTLLKLFLPDGPHDITLTPANLTVDYQIAVALPTAGQTTNSLRVMIRNLSFATTGITVQPFGNPVGDSFLNGAMAQANLTPSAIADQVQGRLMPALQPLGDRLAPLLQQSLDLQATADRPPQEVVGVEAEPNPAVARETRTRFATRRTDKICFMVPGVGMTCVDPIQRPGKHCFRTPKLGEVCTRPIKPPPGP
jgi:hypothetical protein